MLSLEVVALLEAVAAVGVIEMGGAKCLWSKLRALATCHWSAERDAQHPLTTVLEVVAVVVVIEVGGAKCLWPNLRALVACHWSAERDA